MIGMFDIRNQTRMVVDYLLIPGNVFLLPFPGLYLRNSLLFKNVYLMGLMAIKDSLINLIVT
jgi:hypothetical protein